MMMTTLPSNSKLKLPQKIVVTIFAPQKLPPIRPWKSNVSSSSSYPPLWSNKNNSSMLAEVRYYIISYSMQSEKVICLNNNRFGFPLLRREVHDDTSNQSRWLISYAHRPLRNAMRLPFKSHWSVFYCDYWPFLYH